MGKFVSQTNQFIVHQQNLPVFMTSPGPQP